VTSAQESRPPITVKETVGNTAPLSSIDSAGDVFMGEPVESVTPKYPKNALANHVQGAVVLRIGVGKNGKVKNVTVISGDPQLADAAIGAVHKWTYAPFLNEGKHVEAQTSVNLNFEIDDAGDPQVLTFYRVPLKPGMGELVTLGPGVSPPKAIYMVDPQYSETAQRAGSQGLCVVSLTVGLDGQPYDIQVKRNLGMGLDEEATEAVKQWKFKLATKDGRPIAMPINVEIQFTLDSRQ